MVFSSGDINKTIIIIIIAHQLSAEAPPRGTVLCNCECELSVFTRTAARCVWGCVWAQPPSPGPPQRRVAVDDGAAHALHTRGSRPML